MGYIGNQTSNSYSSMDKQTITGNGGASYTLTHAVANAQEIEVFVNNVRQEAGVAYTVSGTALTMTGNVASTDDFYVIYQGKALQTVVPPDGSVTAAKLDTGAAASNLGTSINLATIKDSAGSNTAITIDSSGRVLKPQHIGFFANHDNSSTADGATFDNWETPQFNAGSHFSTTTGKFVAPIAGLYFFGFTFLAPNGTAAYAVYFVLKSGATTTSMVRSRDDTGNSRHQTVSGTATFNLAVNDEVYLVNESGGSTAWGGFGSNFWMTFHGHLVG